MTLRFSDGGNNRHQRASACAPSHAYYVVGGGMSIR